MFSINTIAMIANNALTDKQDRSEHTKTMMANGITTDAIMLA
jgi:hypothetical protein